LSSVSIEELSKDEKNQRAFDLCMSALLAKGLYNFGELLMHPILNSLTNTKNQWLGNLLKCYNSGIYLLIRRSKWVRFNLKISRIHVTRVFKNEYSIFAREIMLDDINGSGI
jgi:hypothetical protein